MDKLRLEDKKKSKQENQRKIVFFSGFIVIIILLTIFNIIGVKEIEDIKLPKLYANLMKDNNYSLKLILDNKNTKIISRKDNMARIDQNNNGVESTTIVKDGNTMLLNHNKNTYSIYKNNVQQLNNLNEELQAISKQ